jgi:predicted TIM-barrel fold metal-dependent hydrolase
MRRTFIATLSLLVIGLAMPSAARSQEDIKELRLRDWQPRPMLTTRETEISKPKFPCIDVHNHLGGGKAFLTAERVQSYLTEMDAAGVRTVVNLDGGWGDQLKETLAALDQAHPGRFLSYALINFEGLDQPDWSDREAKRLEESFRAGAKGLKFHKTLGLGVRYKDGRLLAVDDKKLDPIWEMCATHMRPVEIHTGDPGAFFTPLDRFNERWHELNAHPEWLFHGKDYPARAELHAQRNRVIARHPKTTFICAHFANDGEDLAAVGNWLDSYPNMYIDIDARISELGRVPYSARRFFIKYQDRIMFGTDTPPSRDAYRMYYRFLETDDEYFDPARGHHRQGFWMIYGVFLPDEVLAKLYNGNARRLLVGLEPTPAAPAR